MMEEVWKASWECVKALLEKKIKEYEDIIEKKNQEIRQEFSDSVLRNRRLCRNGLDRYKRTRGRVW